MRNEFGIVSIFVALLLAPLAARAQLLDTLLPPAIPGYGQKFSVIAEHRALAPGATGWALDGISAAPSLALAAGYDSAPGGGGGGSLVLQTTPSLLLADPVAGFGLYAQSDAAAYPQDAAQNTSASLIAAGERITMPRETVTASAALLHSAATGFAFGTSLITRPIPFTLENARLDDAIASGLFILTPDLSLSRYSFAAAASTANRTEARGTATLAYAPGGPLTALLRAGATGLDYRLAAQNAGIYEFLAGAQERQDGLWTISLLAGFARRQPSQGTGLTAPVLEARTDWMPTGLDQISVTASREIDDPDAISASPYTLTSIKLAASQEYLENVTVKLLADFAAAQYIHSKLREYLATGEFNMQWRATPALALAGDYTFNTRQANMLGAANEHVVTLGLTWTP